MIDAHSSQLEHSDTDPLTLHRRVEWTSARSDRDVAREWLVTNGLGGYASGTVAGALTRRFHGLLIAALPAPRGRLMLFNHLAEQVRCPDGAETWLTPYGEHGALQQADGSPLLVEFRLESGLPTWRFVLGDTIVERSLMMPHGQNTVHTSYRLVAGDEGTTLTLRPFLGFRRHEGLFEDAERQRYDATTRDQGVEVQGTEDMPALRFAIGDAGESFTIDPAHVTNVYYAVEARRGYDHSGSLSSPGCFRVGLTRNHPVTLTASTEPWETINAVSPHEADRQERARRSTLVMAADGAARGGAPAELVLAADQFIITPASRPDDRVSSEPGSQGRTVIAGYHWFTDWGRDTMISLEGLTLVTGRHQAARQILRMFSQHVRHGLIPNLFPEGEQEGLYHTADATLWFFHAIDRYEQWTHDMSLVDQLLPVLEEIVSEHVTGTLFGIGVDEDGLLRQGAEGYQLTWMDAKVDGWVVTPRRGKPVEINALWYNALRLLTVWLEQRGRTADARLLHDRAEHAHTAFNARFWSDDLGYLFDVVDGEDGDDPACRPNQVLAMSLPHPVLDRSRWPSVLETVRTRLLTPRGLRSLAPAHPDYKPRYSGDLRTRDAAYHQGTVWSWLIGPFVDACLALHPDDKEGPRAALRPMLDQLDQGCIGSISEIFDGDPPFTSRGCIAQAWGVAELLRALVRTEYTATPVDQGRTAR